VAPSCSPCAARAEASSVRRGVLLRAREGVLPREEEDEEESREVVREE
jgi:hypothetical protein